ncbi:SURF1 family protein [soil metagenome]
MSAAATSAAPAPRRTRMHRGLSVFGWLMVLVALGVLLSLGQWQLQRKAWKEHLLARIAQLKDSPSEPLNVVFNRVRDGGELDFVRVVARCDGLGERAVHLYAIRPDGSPGWRQVGACRLANAPYGAILVDLGFEDVPATSGGESTGMPLPGAEPVLLPTQGALITGVLRTPDPKAWYDGLLALALPGQVKSGNTDPHPRAGASFFGRDIPAMAVALGAERPAPVMLSLETPRAGPKLTPAGLPTDIPNRHLEYAITWFGLAAALVGFVVVRLLLGLARRRKA